MLIRSHRLIAVLSVGCLWLPMSLWIVGQQADKVENRKLATAPGIGAGWDYFKALGPFINDHLPLKQRAIAADAWIDIHLFGENPSFGGSGSPKVIAGSQGYLYFNDDFTRACSPELAPAEVAAHLARLASIIQTSGRRVITAVAPDKSTVLTQYLPKNMLLQGCRDANSAALWEALRNANIPGYIDLRDVLLNAMRQERQSLFFRKDTHWDSAGSLVATKQFIGKLQPELWNDSLVSDGGLIEYEGDLTTMRGLPEADEAPSFSVNRDGVSVVKVEQAPGFSEPVNVRTIRSEPNGKLIKGRTLFLIDSFGYKALPQLAPFFEDLTTIELFYYEPQKFLRLINEADTVLIMSVERLLANRMLAGFGSDSFFQSLSSSLVSK